MKQSELLDQNNFENCKKSGYVPPQAFLNLDKNGYIQDSDNVPILYHYKRNKYNKKIEFDSNNIGVIQNNKIYSEAIPNVDKLNFYRLNFKKYWWLSKDDKYMKEIQLKYEMYKRLRRSRL